jgi:tripartite-type tricarboxylate transporter receptor subunit TctC
VQRLHKELTAVVGAPAVVNKLTPFGMILQSSKTPEDFRRQIASDAAWMTDVAKELKLEAN